MDQVGGQGPGGIAGGIIPLEKTDRNGKTPVESFFLFQSVGGVPPANAADGAGAFGGSFCMNLQGFDKIANVFQLFAEGFADGF